MGWDGMACPVLDTKQAELINVQQAHRFPGSPSQASGRLRAHYHCVVCSVTIARKTDMVSHLKRHVNKGETEASYSGGPDVLPEDHGNHTADNVQLT